ncbi:SRPBCC family protein [Candidatus Desantisbacteria bacterium]|nr:SRPBCC family protein [Candidatus Desantisbacteria bacterium]
MISIRNEIIVDAAVSIVFNIAADMEKYPEFIPTYKKVRIVQQDGQRMIIERVGLVGKKEVMWKSEVWLEAEKTISAVQLEGPLQGMMVKWQFEKRDGRTRILLVHDFEYKKIPLIGNLIAKFIIAQIVSRMADETLVGIRRRVEEFS